LEHKQILNKLKSISAGLVMNTKNTFVPAPDYEPEAKLKVLSKKTAQTHLALGFYGIHRDHPDKHIYSLLHVILGANMSSRLFSEVREKRGLAYQIGTQIKGFADTGMFLIRAGVDNTKLHKAVEVIVKELEKIKKRLVSSYELSRAKEFYIGQLRLALEDTSDHMFWLGEPTLHLNKTYSFPGILKEVKKIKPYDLRRVARSVLKPQAMRLAVIGPGKQVEKKLYACIREL
jgi:predicted Zn-dependent peptidase